MTDSPTSNPVDVAMMRELKRLSESHSGYLGDMLGNAALRLQGMSEEIERLRAERDTAREALRVSEARARELSTPGYHRLRAALELRETALRLIAAGPPIAMENNAVASWAAFVAQEGLGGAPAETETGNG